MAAKGSGNTLKTVMVVAVLMAAASIAKADPPACTYFNKKVTAHISTANGNVSVAPDRICVASGGRVYWTIDTGQSWATDFTDDARSAFPAGQAHHEGQVKKSAGGKVRSCSTSDPAYNATAGGCVYSYKATHTIGSASAAGDPDVVIKPGT